MENNKEYLRCLRCNRKLKNEEAKKMGYGKVCLEKMRTQSHTRKLFEVKHEIN